MKKLLILGILLSLNSCIDTADVKKTLIVRKVESTSFYDSKYRVYFEQETYHNDIVFYTDHNYKVGDTLIK